MTLLAQSAATPEPRYGFGTLGPLLDQPGGLTIAGLLLTACLAFVLWLYWRESRSLSRPALIALLMLRLGALAAVVVYALAPEKRDARQEVRPSQVLLITDDSLSMALPNTETTDESTPLSRWRAIQQLLEVQGLLAELRTTHEVHLAPSSNPREALLFAQLNPEAESNDDQQPTDFEAALTARTSETRLGDAIEQALNVYAGGPLAAIVIVSDGQNNAGASPELAAATAGEQEVPVHTIGLGSKRPAPNIAVRDLLAPRRAYPKDRTPISALIESHACDGQEMVASLYETVNGATDSKPRLLDSQTIKLGPDGAAQSLTFVAQADKPGTYEYRLEVAQAKGERDTSDNTATVEVQVVDRTLKVMLIAGGPTRDYHFLRDQLRRDDSFEVDVLLQSAPGAASQDASKVLSAIPTDQEKLDAYDLFVAYDVDWTVVPDNSVAAIHQAVSRGGAGFVFVTGPVHTPRWLREEGSPVLKSMLPVHPAPLSLLLGATHAPNPKPSAVQLTRAGREASFLWLLGEQATSVALWDEFPGFYSTAETGIIKPGATVYAEVAPQQSSGGNSQQVLFAEQFLGAGRCFYIGAPEMWRLRLVDPAAFRAFTTKLLQHLSQGRLLADSRAGSLLFERDRYNVGDMLTLRATLSDQATTDLSPDTGLAVQVQLPTDRIVSLPLTKPDTPDGAWTASLAAQDEGAHSASLTLPSSSEPLTAKTIVRVPALERSRTTRDTTALREIAQASGGYYYDTPQAVMTGEGDTPSLASAIPSKAETLTIYGSPDEAFARTAAKWLLAVIAGCLLCEWALRRLLSLA